MKNHWLRLGIPLTLLAVTLLFSGCARDTASVAQQEQTSSAQTEKQKATVYTGSIVGKSNKAQTVSIEVGKGADAQTYMLKFDDDTTGIEHAEPGEAAIINWEQRGEDKFAVEIKPKLATLPEGVTKIDVDELYQLIENDAPMVLVDARPESRYHQAHLPGAVNIPVPLLTEKKEAVLPKDKDTLLIFYCGGFT
ncbi:MAG: rhodanese-like domain-containing protein [Desulfofustis sp.]|nr:rhodanese-like domain-containing protein [Desulfofustis sp.]